MNSCCAGSPYCEWRLESRCIFRKTSKPAPTPLSSAECGNRNAGSFVSFLMNERSPFAAAGSVLGALACIAVPAYLAACGGGGSDPASAAQPQFGQMTLRITDSPVTSAERVVVEFTGLEIKPLRAAEPEVFNFDSPRR